MNPIARHALPVTLLALALLPLAGFAAQAPSAPPAGAAPALPLPSEQEAIERQADRVKSLTHTAEEILGPMPALAGTPFFGLAALSGVALLTDTETVRLSSNGFLRAVRDNELVREARRYATLPLFLTLAALSLVAYLINSGKIRGAAGKLLRPLEDVSVAVVYSLLALGTFRGTMPVEHGKVTIAAMGIGAGGWPSTTLLLSLGVLGGMAVMMVARFALDVLIWLIPVPWIDFLFETTKKLLSVGIMALCFLSPAFAAGLAVVCLLFAILVSGWALRMLGFTFHILLRPWLVRLFPDLGHPKLDDERLLSHLAPDLRPALLAVPATALSVVGMPKRQSGCLVKTETGLVFATRTRLLRRKRRPLGGGRPVLVRTLLWLELRVPRQDGRGHERLALSRTLLPQAARLRQLLGAEDGGSVGAARFLAALGNAPGEEPLGVA